MLSQENEAHRRVRTKLPVDTCLKNHAGVKHDPEPGNHDPDVIAETGWLNASPEQGHNGEKITADIEQSGNQTHLQTAGIFRDADVVLRLIVPVEVVCQP